MQKRVLARDLQDYVNKQVLIKGWLYKVRDIGKIAFLLLRDRSGFVQVVVEDKEEIKKVRDLLQGSVLYVTGTVVETGRESPKYEIKDPKVHIEVAVKDAPPIKYYLKDLDVNLDTELDYRALSIRNLKIAFIFKMQAKLLQYIREAFVKRDFTEFRPATLVPFPSESGADVFEVNFFDKRVVYLAQSPQFHKQIALGAFERVFSVTPVFRAEKHDTSRHLLEITQIDGEMAFIDDYLEVVNTAEDVLRDALQRIGKEYKQEFKEYGFEFPIGVEKEWPKLKVKEILKIIEERTGKSANRDELDLDPEDERIIGEYVKEKYGTDFVWALNFKAHKNPYTRDDPENPDESLSYDLIFRGLEVLSGTWRINKYEELKANLQKISDNLDKYKMYLDAFKYGMPPEAGFSFGLERLTKQLFNLKNIRQATMFLTDLHRVGGQKIKE